MTPTVGTIETLINQGRYFEARAMAQEALKSSTNLRVKQLLGLAISKAGVPKAAAEFLEPVYRAQPDDPETAGIMGGIYKAIFRKDQDTQYAFLSRDTYLKNFTLTRNYYTGINAATMSAIIGQAAKGREIAKEVLSLLPSPATSFWEQVTLAEALLLNKEREKSLAAYFEAKKMAGTDWGKISTVHSQLWLLNHYVSVPKEVLKVFQPPGVVSFIGHMIDHPGRPIPRFPIQIENSVRDAIASALNTLNARIGFCSLACGSDIIFAETMAAAGGELNIWIPFAKEDFIDASIRFAGESWVERFHALVNRFQVTYLTFEPYGGYDDLFSFQNRVIFGSAIIRSAMNHTEPTLLTVLSDTDLRLKEGGTRDTIGLWPYPSRHVNINPDNYFSAATASPPPTPVKLTKPSYPPLDRPVLYGLVADLPGMTKQEQEAIWNQLDAQGLPMLAPATIETGEILMISFGSILGAMDAAKVILREVKEHYLGSRLRMSLFAIPIHLVPGKEKKQKLIAEESRTKIIELHSLVPPGAIYAFARFSSALSLDVQHYSVDYAGVVSLEWHPQPIEIYRVNFLESPI